MGHYGCGLKKKKPLGVETGSIDLQLTSTDPRGITPSVTCRPCATAAVQKAS